MGIRNHTAQLRSSTPPSNERPHNGGRSRCPRHVARHAHRGPPRPSGHPSPWSPSWRTLPRVPRSHARVLVRRSGRPTVKSGPHRSTAELSLRRLSGGHRLGDLRRGLHHLFSHELAFPAAHVGAVVHGLERGGQVLQDPLLDLQWGRACSGTLLCPSSHRTAAINSWGRCRARGCEARACSVPMQGVADANAGGSGGMLARVLRDAHGLLQAMRALGAVRLLDLLSPTRLLLALGRSDPEHQRMGCRTRGPRASNDASWLWGAWVQWRSLALR